jgi:hypothetical protein
MTRPAAIDEVGEVVADAVTVRRWAEHATPGSVFVYATALRLTPALSGGREAQRLCRDGLVLLTQAPLPGRAERAYRATRSSKPWPAPVAPRADDPEVSPDVLDAVFDLVARAARFARPCPTDAQLAERAEASREAIAAALGELAETGAITIERVRAPTLRQVRITATGLVTGWVK